MRKHIIVVLLMITTTALAQTQLVIPDTLTGSSFQLTAHADSVAFFPTGPLSPTYAFNQYSYLGPTLILNKGDSISITVNNQIGDTTTIHWHGLHVPARFDGGPHTPIMPGMSWNPSFKVMDQAATYWYHPHMHMKTAIQAIRGAAGLIIVRDSNEATLQLPRTYGIDDFPIIVQCQQYDSVNAAMPLGMEDSTLLVNGSRANNGYSVYANVPAQFIRLRLLNASGERVFNFGFSGNMNFQMIASDGGLLNAPVLLNRIRLAPGERAEIVLDLTSYQGQTFNMLSYASELPIGVQGGPTMPMPSGPPMDSPLNGIDFNIMAFNVVGPSANPVQQISATLNSNLPYDTTTVNEHRTIRFTADSAMVMDGPFYFNDSLFSMNRVDFTIPLNSTEKWKLVNETMVAHPFHIHDVQFYVVNRSGMTPPLEEQGRKDVVLVPPGDSLEFVTRFEDYTDSMIPYMYHCHILMHEDAGMMGQFRVVQNITGLHQPNSNEFAAAYPNPLTTDVSLQVNEDFSGTAELSILNSSGIFVEKRSLQFMNGKASCELKELSAGFYIGVISTMKYQYKVKFIKAQN